MAVTYGFYNALNHDRLYDAIQMSSIFDGIIRDGIFSTIGDTMIVTAPEDGLYVNVGSGRAWFNHTWTLNDADYPIEAEEAEVVLDRIDAVILEVNSSTEVRANSIKFLKGTPSSNPVKPTLTHNAEVNQYALAYVKIRAGQTTIFQSDIENAVGTDETPFITGVLQQVSIETLLQQWEAEFNTYFTNFQNTSTTEFDDWFQRMKDQLSQDAAGNLQLQIDDIADEKANNDIISDAWNVSTTYAVGQYCIYNNSLWKCLVQHSGQTPTEGTYWTKVTVTNEITSVNNSLRYSTTEEIICGTYNGKKLYRKSYTVISPAKNVDINVDTIENIEQLVNVSIITGGDNVYFSNWSDGKNYWANQVTLDSNNNKIYVIKRTSYNTDSANNANIYCTIEYTKNTDQTVAK